MTENLAEVGQKSTPVTPASVYGKYIYSVMTRKRSEKYMYIKSDLPFKISSSLAKGFWSTSLPINPWQISIQKLGDALVLSSKQVELCSLQIYILIDETTVYIHVTT